MANGYLGKISAIVSANTADFDSKLSKSAGEVRKFAGSMQGTLTSAQTGAGNALRGIYTEAQKVERALQAVASQKLAFKGFQGANLPEAVKQMQAVFSVSQQISKPLAAAAKSLGGLSAEIQAEFLPAMISAQTATEKLSEVVDRTGSAGVKHFQSVERQVSRTTAAISRLKEASDLAGSLSTGNELRFQRPSQVAEMKRSASIQSDIESLPASMMGGMDSFVAQQKAAAEETNRLAAALEKAKLARKGDVAGNVAAAEAAYKQQLALQQQLNNAIEAEVASRKRAIGEAGRQAENEIALIQRREQAAKSAEAERLAQAQKVADGELANLQRVQQAAKSAEAERLAQAQRVADGELANLQRVQQAAKAAEAERLALVQSREDGDLATLIRREQGSKAAELGGEGGTNLGLDIDAPRRQLDVLEGSIVSLKGQIDQLPEPMRTRFVPAIRDAEQEFIRLSASANPVAGQIEAARARLAHLTQEATRASQAMNFSQSFGGSGMTGINLGLDQRSLQGYNAQLQILQGYMARIPGALAGPAIASFNQLRNAIAAAFDDGTINTADTRRELAALLAATTQTTAALSGVSASRIGRDIQRAGDIGRMGFDRFSMAVNQGVYVIDDFFSATGGLEQKLRAIGNNVTQLGFILGGTTGLVIGLSAVLVGQLAVGLIKWINNGRTTEDQTKSLNDALARQKSLVEELAEAFRSLGDSVTQNVFSESAKQAKDFAKQIDDILKKQRELGIGRVAGGDAKVQQERAEQNKLKREIDKEENPLVRAGKQRMLRASEEREARRTRLLEVLPPPAAAEIRREVRLRAPVGFRDGAEGIPEGSDLDSQIAQAQALQPAVDKLGEIIASGDATFGIASRQLEVLGNLLDRLNRSIGDALAEAAVEVVNASRGPAEDIRNAQEEVAQAIKAGLPGARLFGLELDKNAQALEDATKNLEKANAEDGGTPEEKKKLIEDAKAKVDNLRARREGIVSQADALRYERTVDPQRQMDARAERVGANLGDAGLQSGQIARRMRETENQRETIRQQASKEENQNPIMQGFFEGQQAALNAEVAAIEASTIALKMFSDALNRASEEAKSNLNSAQSAADEARRADLGNSTVESVNERRSAAVDLNRQRNLEKDAQREIENQRAREEEVKRGPEFQRMQQIDEELRSGSLTAAEQEKLRAERAGLEAKVEPQLQAGRMRAERAVEASTREEEVRKSASRGRALRKTPEENFAKETEQGLNDIRMSFVREAENGGRNVDAAGVQEAEQRYIADRKKEARTATSAGRGREAFLTDREKFARDSREGIVRDMTAGAIDQAGINNVQGRRSLLEKGLQNQLEQVAPGIAAFDEERKTAQIQGPSRAALNVTDVSTSQGASELTRLLRGDDSAKDVNLAELRKQTSKFDDLIQAVKDANPGVIP
jgi:hypothetical protein